MTEDKDFWGDDGYTISVSDNVPLGEYVVTVHYKNGVGHKYTDTITVNVEPAPASIYYLKSPTSNPRANAESQWSDSPIGTGYVNTAGATWEDSEDVSGDEGKDKNIMVNPGGYITSMPEGMTEVTVDGQRAWSLDLEKYKDECEAIVTAWEKTLVGDSGGDVLTLDDIDAIYLVPYKISRNNGTDENSLPKHIDCDVKVITKEYFLAEFNVIMPDGRNEPVYDERLSYEEGEKVEITKDAPTEGEGSRFPQTKKYNGVTYEFVGWYNEAGELLDEQFDWPYEPKPEELEGDNTVVFTAKYEPVEYDLIVKKTLSGNMYNAADTFKFTVTYNDETKEFTLGKDGTYDEISIPNGAKVTITENGAEDYEFSVTSSDPTTLDNYTVDAEGKSVTFTMPANDVKIVIDNKKDVDIDTGVFLDTLPYILNLGVAAAGAVVLVKRRKHSDD